MTSPHLASPAGAARYLAGYPPELIAQAETLRSEGRLADYLTRRFPERHEVRSDGALYAYVNELKARHLRNAEPLNFVGYDAKLHVLQHALGTHTRRTQVQGARLKMRREIRVATLFKDAPAALQLRHDAREHAGRQQLVGHADELGHAAVHATDTRQHVAQDVVEQPLHGRQQDQDRFSRFMRYSRRSNSSWK